MTREEITALIRQEIARVLGGETANHSLQRHMQVLDGRNLTFGKTTGTQIGTATDEKMGFYGETPIVQPSTTGHVAGFSAGTGTPVNHDSTFDGTGLGGTAYTIGDIVKHLKALGLLA